MANLQIIKDRWEAARKVYGLNDEIATPSGMRIKGRYVLTDSGAATPSHDPFNGFRKSDGFPTDNNGQSVNDRDYERDKDAQDITRHIADCYDSRALNSAVIVSKDGIVLSGNGRTMAGMIAAKDNTDDAYICYLRSYPEKYGFNPLEIDGFEHPRLLFLVDDDYGYTAETFALFNAQEIKSQSKTELAVKLGKVVDDDTFGRIIRNINQFETIGDFYNNTKAATEAVNDLLAAGVISQMQYPEMFDGDSISQSAREILENVLIGKAFCKNADVVRQITAFKGIRKNIITALAEISTNIALGEYSLERETAQAVSLCYQARANGCMRQGDIVSGFARQMTLFSEEKTVADYTDTTVLLLADIINHTQVTRLKKIFAVYNHQAADAANGQTDMFSSGETLSKEEILSGIIKNYGSKELVAMFNEANKQRQKDSREAVLEDRFSDYPDGDDTQRTISSNGVPVGGFAGLPLPSGETIIVRLDYIDGDTAYIRLKGFVRCKITEEILLPTSETKTTLPDWLPKDTPKNRILGYLLSYSQAAA